MLSDSFLLCQHGLCDFVLIVICAKKKKVKFEATGDEQLTRTFLEGLAAVVPTESSTTTPEASELPSQDRVVRPSSEAGEGKGDAAACGEHGKHPDHDGDIFGGQNFASAGGPGEGLRKMDARRIPHGHEESVLASHQTLPRTADDLPKHEQSSSKSPRVQVSDRCGGRLRNEGAGEVPS